MQAGIPVDRVRRDSFFEQPAVREVVRYLHLIQALRSGREAGQADLLAA